MRLTATEAQRDSPHTTMGVLWTVHAERGVDAVPVVYVVDEDGCVGVHGCRVRGLGRTGAVL